MQYSYSVFCPCPLSVSQNINGLSVSVTVMANSEVGSAMDVSKMKVRTTALI